MSARDDHPTLAHIEKHGLFNVHEQMTAALDEIDRLRADRLEHRSTFHRFKYAEEFAHGVDAYGVPWRLCRGPDETYEEDGETYTNPVYVVEWSGPEEP